VTSPRPTGHNIGELSRRGIALTTGEVLAIAHEACRDATAAFPQTPDDLWISDTGELLIGRSDQLAETVDPRSGVAALLESLLPPDGLEGAGYVVSPALRGLPARLRATTQAIGPQDRRDLMAILAWHLDANPRAMIQELAARVGGTDANAIDEPAAATDGDLELFSDSASPAAAPDGPRAGARKRRAATVLALVGIGVLFIAIGSASYWLFRFEAADQPAPAAAVVAPVETPPPTVPPISAPMLSAPAPPLPKPLNAGAPQPLALDVADGAFSPTFAPSGGDLFFHAGRANAGRLLVANLDSRGQVARVSAVRAEPARNYHPRVSPDGRSIAFDSDRDGERGVYVAARDGSNLQRVSGPGYGAVPSWSPDMKWLAFIRGEPARPRVWNLWLRDLSTGALQRHTAFRSGQVWGASWFPDGRSVCYSHDEQLIISHLDAREDIVVDSPQRGRLVRTPAVSPDGRRVVFQVFRDGVWLLDVDTRSMRRILDDATAEEFAWSPDGARIAYHSRRDGEWKIWVMPIER
jgi:WD40 repeat protein